ncbi:MAG: hypothetical protein JXR13_13125 [Thalassovita sp.]
MRNRFTPFLIATCLTPSVASAYDWSFFALIPDSSCIVECAAENAARAEQIEKMRRPYEKIELELDAILEWMDAQGYAKPFFPANGPNGSSLVTLVDLAQSGSKALRASWENAYGDYTASRGMAINANEMPSYKDPEAANIALATETRDTLAHETYHAVQEATGSIVGDDWVVEGVAEFAGNAWTKRDTQRRYSYAIPLEEPAGAYDRAHFFHMLGKDFGSANAKASYLPDLERAQDTNGLKWMDNYLTGEGKKLSEYFPDFIARHAADGASFYTQDISRGWIDDDDTPRPKVIADTDGRREQSRRFDVAANAGVYMDITPTFEGDFAALEEDARVYINRITVEDGSDPAALSLVVRSEVLGSDPFLEPVFASAGEMKTPFNTRVVNMSDDPTTSADNSAVAVLSTTRVTFGLPACIDGDVSVGIIQSAALPRDEIIKAFQAQGVKLRVKGGGTLSDDFYLTPTTAKGKIEIEATLPTLDGGRQTVTVADTKVHPAGCMIQMRVGEARITWDGSGRYTEFAQAGGSEALYMKDQDFAAFMDGGFQPIPAMAKKMMLGAFKGRFAGGKLEGIVSGMDSVPDMPSGPGQPVGVDVDVDGNVLAQLIDEMPAILGAGSGTPESGEWGMHLMPETFVNRFSWHRLRQLEDRSRRTKAACPAFAEASDAPCSTISLTREGIQGQVIYSDDGWPLEVTMDGETMEFETGNFALRRPPGW